MKRTFAFLTASIILLSMLLVSTEAATREFLQVPYAEEGEIKVDGTIDSAEWENATAFSLSPNASGAKRLYSRYEENVQGLTVQYAWNEKGVYIAAKIKDSELYGDVPMEYMRGSDELQLYFNPVGFISDDYSGLMFVFSRRNDGQIAGIKAYWRQGLETEPEPEEITEPGYKAAYSDNLTGWDLEVFLPMSLIATSDRIYDLDKGEDPTYLLSQVFKPADPSSRENAWCTAMVAYVDFGRDGNVRAMGINGTSSEVTQSFTAKYHPMVLKFNLDGQASQTTEKDSIPAQTKPPVTQAPQTKPPVTQAPQTKPPVTQAPQTKPPVVENGNTGIQTAEPTPNITSENIITDGPTSGPALSYGVIVMCIVCIAVAIGAIVCIAVVIGAVVFVMIKMKKK